MSSSAHECHVIVEPQPASGTWNMAVDEALLEAGLHVQHCVLRLYRWREPTISLGYFQKLADLEGDSRLSALPAVRRLSGGGAILHHLEWTYSCVVPRGNALSREPGRVYDELHEAVMDVLRTHGVCCQLRGAGQSPGDEPFLCFGRGDARDIVCGDHKILGSAQRRRRGVVLQHGSLLLRQSPFATEFPGVLDLHPELRPHRDWWLGTGLADALAESLAGRLGRTRRPVTLADPIRVRARELEPHKAARAAGSAGRHGSRDR